MADFIKNWTEKEVESLTASFKRYNVFVFILKFALPITAAVLLVAIIFFAEKEDKSAKITVENVVQTKIQPEQITSVGVMENPRFQGLDAQNQPYSLTAEKAWQESADEIAMENITADITTDKQSWISVVANKANYFPKTYTAHMRGGVDIFITDAEQNMTQIQTETLALRVKEGIASSSSPVNVTSNLSNFSAQGFVADKNAQKISFTGRVKLVIVP